MGFLTVLAACAEAPRGASEAAATRERMLRSQQWRDGRFRHPQAMWMSTVGAMKTLFVRNPHSAPAKGWTPPAVPALDWTKRATDVVRVTWFGHSSSLVEIDGVRVLIDPVWAERASPVSFWGPKRWYAPITSLDSLPALDVVLISHDHYDHLDPDTLRRIEAKTAVFVVPLGVGARLRKWGLPAEKIRELDWWETLDVAGVAVHATPARHASGRTPFDRDRALWCGFALIGPRHRVYYSGDTGGMREFEEIGRRLGPFDVTLLEVGEYSQQWPDWHMGPEQAVAAHRAVRGRVLLPVHWGLFPLSDHGWTEPIERALVAARSEAIPVATPKPGERLELAGDAAQLGARWWPEVPWRRAEVYPLVSSQNGENPTREPGSAPSATAAGVTVSRAEVERLRREMQDLAFELDRCRQPVASDVANHVVARLDELTADGALGGEGRR